MKILPATLPILLFGFLTGCGDAAGPTNGAGASAMPGASSAGEAGDADGGAELGSGGGGDEGSGVASGDGGGAGDIGGAGGGGGEVGDGGGDGGVPAPADGRFGAPCRRGDDCLSGHCIRAQFGRVCTVACYDDCPDGFDCVGWRQGAEVEFLCSPPIHALCEPCEENIHCMGDFDRCMLIGESMRCGLDCRRSSCPDGYVCTSVEFDQRSSDYQCTPNSGTCDPCIDLDDDGFGNRGECPERDCDDSDNYIHPGAVERCNELDDDCDGAVDEGFPGLHRVCHAGVGLCRRSGVTGCAPDANSVRCNAIPGAPEQERCNGADDDCDGGTDEGFDGLREACSVGVGGCRRTGLRRCLEGGDVAMCDIDPGQPTDELCNGVDDDCDGETDETYDDLYASCSDGEGACLRHGVILCREEGDDTECSTSSALPDVEACNSVDDDCDGDVDEGFADLDTPCFSGRGTCRRAGLLVCADDGEGTRCDAEPGEAVQELCDGLDNDCDGAMDERFDLGRMCERGVGECLQVGVFACAGNFGTRCSARALDPEVEVCDGLDNDCDGSVDEGFPGVGDACEVGRGVCWRSGVVRCTEDGAAAGCTAVAGDAVVEACDGLDNDCDGLVDESFPHIGEACEAGRGACWGSGVVRCTQDGAEARCTADPGIPAAELCDGIDNDCDGGTDETFGDLFTACSAGEGRCRRMGVRVCGVGRDATVCDAQAGQAADERCTGLDDDCDGDTDEGFADVGDPCVDGLGLCLRTGVRRCSDDGESVECGAEAGPAAATDACDGFDDDCDGAIDEDFVGLRTPCAEGVGSCERDGVWVCGADGQGLTCNAQAGQAVDETCNGLDDDCDGSRDEDFPTLQTVCRVGEGVCERVGMRQCAADGAAVACNVEAGVPTAEVCDGLDNDCDGRTDEGYAGLGEVCVVGAGACERSGTTRCSADGQGVECSVAAGVPAAERCDRVDNDCDGATDEDWAELGQACAVGAGLCRRSGVNTCDAPRTGIVCDAVAGESRPAELCDYEDDDCDGEADEDFVDGSGRYATVADCGACGNDCETQWDPDPAAFGVTSACSVSGDVFQCSYDCLAGFVDADRVAGNGCELEIDEDAVYVATTAHGGVDAADCGDLGGPCSSIAQGIARADALGRARVRVSDGLYEESFDLVGGLEVLGGHHSVTWARDPALNVTIVEGRGTDGDHRYTVRALDIDVATTLDGFVIYGQSPLSSGNAYAIYVRDSDESLALTNNRIFAGDGGRGGRGDAGASGAAGLAGAAGAESVTDLNPAPCFGDPADGFAGSPGGSGGELSCGVVAVDGGAGGYASCPERERQEGSGVDGATALGGTGGPGAWGMTAGSAGSCTVSSSGAPDGPPGEDGTAGGDGAGGAGGADAGQIVDDHWQGAVGVAGVDGTPGGGAGGGGAAAGVDVAWFGSAADIGATGGGGGSGGCGGLQGTGATPGGASFGVFVVFTGPGPRQARQFPVLEDNDIARGLGGVGGDGGTGGGGGEGGAGAAGGVRGADLLMGFCSFLGGEGGAGGRGGHAGGGGGAQGGASFDIFVGNDNDRSPDYAALNTSLFEAAEDTGGGGGSGGNSSNTDIGLGGDGVAGPFGVQGALP